jgi:hypothetical protein
MPNDPWHLRSVTKEHSHKPAYARDDWTCDNANNLHVIPRGSLCYGCRLCNHDISKACYTTWVEPQIWSPPKYWEDTIANKLIQVQGHCILWATLCIVFPCSLVLVILGTATNHLSAWPVFFRIILVKSYRGVQGRKASGLLFRKMRQRASQKKSSLHACMSEHKNVSDVTHAGNYS